MKRFVGVFVFVVMVLFFVSCTSHLNNDDDVVLNDSLIDENQNNIVDTGLNSNGQELYSGVFGNDIVNVKTRILIDNVVCTKMKCNEDNKCCNDCKGTPVILIENANYPVYGERCAGDNCKLQCEPFASETDIMINGTFVEKYGETYVQILESVATE